MAEVANLPQRRVSRYRSQRIQASQHSSDAPPVPLSTSIPDTAAIPTDPIARSRSRYRAKSSGARSNGSQDNESSKGQAHDRIPAIPELPDARSNELDALQQELSPRAQTRHKSTGQDASRQRAPQRQTSTEQFTTTKLGRRVESRTDASIAGSQTATRNGTPQHQVPQPSRSPPRTSEPFQPIQPESVQAPVKLDGPPVSGQIRATKETVPAPDADEHGIKNAFGLFKRKRDQSSKDLNSPETTESTDDGPILEPVDAPVSAVNAGERRVLLECGTYKMMYPVTPTTTPVDLIKSAAITMSEPINVKSAILLEYFGKVGVHRAIRRYEHLRDVMNSWDHDSQNSLLLIDPGTGTSETELSLLGAPKSKPGNVSWTLYYSQSIGKWDKRLIHLKRDGQITMQKDPKKPNEQVNLCHLSDFDVYTPTQEKIKKKVKPPKKHCFAIKSQQKSSMFENSTNFVHFFCTGDQTVGDDFHAAVQAWRSWYLVNIMGEGDMVDAASPPSKRFGTARALAVQTHQRIASIETPYQLGTFTPLLDLDQFSKDNMDHDVGSALPSPIPLHSRRTNSVSMRDHARHAHKAPNADDEALAHLSKRSSDASRPTATALDQSRTQRRLESLDLKRTDSAHPRSHRPLVILASTKTDGVPTSNSLEIRQSMDADTAFTGEGLLARSQTGWGNGTKGRGVLDGSHAKGPMVQMSDDTRFVQGSLLQQVARRQAPQAPINICRERAEERDYRTGEGL